MSAARLPFAAVLAIFMLTACGERWSGFVYPNKQDLSSHQAVGDHPSLEACRLAAADLISVLPGGGRNADYECGLDCKSRSGLLVCSRTDR
jgi:hypothetical protein